MKMDFQASSLGRYNNKANEVVTPKSAANSYALRGNWRFGLSGAYFIGRHGFISADYDYTSGSLRLSNSTYDEYDGSEIGFEEDNARLKTNFGGVHTVRLGAELCLATASPSVLATATLLRPSRMLVSRAIWRRPKYSSRVPRYTTPSPTARIASRSVRASASPPASRRIWRTSTQTPRPRTFAFPYVNDYGTYLNASDADIRAGKVKPDELVGMQAIKETNQRHKAVATLSIRF